MSGCYDYQYDHCNEYSYDDCYKPRHRRHHKQYNDCWNYSYCS
jgi:hypothetical protein